MSNPSTPEGWYPDPWQQAPQRWWDGTQWTSVTSRYSGSGERPLLPDDAPVYGPLIWVLALLPLLGLLIWFVHIDLTPVIDQMREQAQQQQLGPDRSFSITPVDPFSMYRGGTLWAELIGWLSYPAGVVLGLFDWMRLKRVGVVRPFHWAWSFLASPVYVIGRSVIVRRVAAPRGLAPVWLLIGAYAVSIISSGIWVSTFMSQFFSQLSSVMPTS